MMPLKLSGRKSRPVFTRRPRQPAPNSCSPSVGRVRGSLTPAPGCSLQFRRWVRAPRGLGHKPGHRAICTVVGPHSGPYRSRCYRRVRCADRPLVVLMRRDRPQAIARCDHVQRLGARPRRRSRRWIPNLSAAMPALRVRSDMMSRPVGSLTPEYLQRLPSQ